MSDERCEWFRWIGGYLCDRCGREPEEHQGYEWTKPGASPFGQSADFWEQRPWCEIRRVPLLHHVFGDVQSSVSVSGEGSQQ